MLRHVDLCRAVSKLKLTPNLIVMQPLIQRVLDKIDQQALRQELGFLKEKDAELDAIKEDVRDAKKHVSFWDRVNVFVSTDDEQDLKSQKRALNESHRDHQTITENIKTLIRDAIEQDAFVQFKMYLGELANDAERLQIVRAHGHAAEFQSSHFRIQGVDQLFLGIERMDMLLARESGIDPGKMDEAAVVGLVYDDILRSSGFIH